ncbi:hypothetical protein SERLA73DRAFT_179284 [Serpula lacrymans var. lacrymans S7.3]|uniref:Phosphoglycerate mutase-like protein n=2 Tax=Serpula lacrymans var. lacrymans TaxID=341189 RepID=F8PRU7_SERL3|nr:uncharacterized protein SERLADRAFT_464332 [Serpula lacrymans var. lacrymans S7.9]EGO01182.1 hypothetical protein SERLA73DRAFT_179284 [Serpula lacrymans var. lacrymans S7.3]EGO26830.1 hypothetical protein SERLADRAFT_464332 [Serpula lacrymans var. lacrymans S7.9]
MVNSTGLLGVVLLARHGDRLEFFQDPNTYTPTETYLTPLGSVQELQLGTFLRSQYLTPSSPSFISGISTDVVNINQISVQADAGGGGSVILNSVQGLLQGLYPPTTESNITLANGTTIVGPLGGYQYIPVDSIEPNVLPTLNSFTNCPNFNTHVSEFYASPAFLQEAQDAAPFLDALEPYLGGRSNNFTNMYNIFDYVNVQSVHNATFYKQLPPTFAAQSYYYANYHEYGVFSAPTPNGIGNIAAATLLPTIFTALQDITNSSNGLKIALTEVSYKPFISMFNVTQADVTDPDIAGIVDYASVVALEVYEDSNSRPYITMKFKNGTTETDYRQLSMFGNTTVYIDDFISQLAGSTINTTQQWCQACNQTSSWLSCNLLIGN